MNIVIIEDELLAADDLRSLILQAEPQARIEVVLSSVKEAIRYFSNQSPPDLIFSDIRLGDSLSFDLFQKTDLKVPVIFCTDYDEYTIDALKANGIPYVLKPFNGNEIKGALKKYMMMRSRQSPDIPIRALLREFQSNKLPKPASILVYRKNEIFPVKLNSIALFYRKYDITHLYTFDRKTFLINWTLDKIQQLDDENFFRANRQYIIHRNAVHSISKNFNRKLTVKLTIPIEEAVTISKKKATLFLDWLKG